MVQIERTYSRTSPKAPEVSPEGAQGQESLYDEFSKTLKQVMFQLSRQGITDTNAMNLHSSSDPKVSDTRAQIQPKIKTAERTNSSSNEDVGSKIETHDDMNFTGVFSQIQNQTEKPELKDDKQGTEQDVKQDEDNTFVELKQDEQNPEIEVAVTEQAASSLITSQQKEVVVVPQNQQSTDYVEVEVLQQQIAKPTNSEQGDHVEVDADVEVPMATEGLESNPSVQKEVAQVQNRVESTVAAPKNSETLNNTAAPVLASESIEDAATTEPVVGSDVNTAPTVDTSLEEKSTNSSPVSAPQTQVQAQRPQVNPTDGGSGAITAAATRTEKGTASAATPLDAIRSAIEETSKSATTTRPVGQLSGTEIINTRQGGEISARSNNEKATRSLSRVLSSKVLERVEEVLKEAARSKDGKSISFRLDPPELGAVKIDVTLREGVLHARMVAESPAVNQLLKEKAPELQALLRRLGLDVEQVTVAVRGDSPDLSGGRSDGNSFSNFSNLLKDGSPGRGKSGQGRNEVGNEVEIQNPAAVVGVQTGVVDHWVA